MAYGCNADDDYHQLGMYSMINGIEVKIGEKFKVPDKVLLPIGWKPSDPCELLQFEYDFWKENEVIQKAEEERLTQVQMTSNIENEEKEDTPVDSETGVDNDDKEDEDDESPNTSSESNVNEILTPFVMPSEGVENKCSETHKKINLEDFEGDKNQNPFELVELQTLDEYDELRSVLDPGKKEKKVIKSKCLSNNYENFELDANFFNNVDVAKPVTPVASVLNYSDDQSNPISEPVKTSPDEFNIPEHVAKGTLNWTKFNKDTLAYRGCDPAQMYTQNIDQMPQSMSNMQINGQIHSVASNQSNVQVATSVSNEQIPLMQSGGVVTNVYNPGMMSQSVTNISNVTMNTEIANDDIQINNSNLSYGQRLFMTDDLQQTKRTKSMPDLEGMTDKSLAPNEVLFNNNLSPMEPNQLRFNIDNSQSDNVVRTDRIDSIMKQYQFQRLSNMPVTVSNLPQANGSNVPPVNMSNIPQASISNVPASLPVAPQVMPQGGVNMSAASNYNSASNIPNMTQYVGLPGFTSQPVSTMTTESYPKPVQPGIHPNIPVSSLPSPVIPNSSSNRTQISTSAFNIQGMSANVTNANIPSTTNYPVGTNNPSGVNPFSQPNLPNQNNTHIPTSMYRHGVLPPLPGERSQLAGCYNPVVSQPLPYNPSYVMSSAAPLPDTDIRASPSPRIPNIPSQECYNPNINGIRNTQMSSQERSSWLVDPIEELSMNQKNFAYQIAAMGFSLPCVARTVMRVGIDEKEVLDFLCSVQDLKEKDYHSDDVEMALLNLQNEKEKVPSYLEMVNTLRELGFKPSEIHNALIKTSVDQNKAIDYLTSSR